METSWACDMTGVPWAMRGVEASTPGAAPSLEETGQPWRAGRPRGRGACGMFTQGLEGGLTGETEAGRPADVGARGPCKGGEEVQQGTPGDQGIPRVVDDLGQGL